jgi:PadR family transcriptional regulator PadR
MPLVMSDDGVLRVIHAVGGFRELFLKQIRLAAAQSGDMSRMHSGPLGNSGGVIPQEAFFFEAMNGSSCGYQCNSPYCLMQMRFASFSLFLSILAKMPRGCQERIPTLLDIVVRPLYNAVRYRMKSTILDSENPIVDRDLFSGLMRLHILHHAVEEPIFGLGMLEELARHGYRISPGTLYPLLHGLEKKGYLRARELRNGKSLRKVYRATPLGRKALEAAKIKVREFIGELFEGE